MEVTLVVEKLDQLITMWRERYKSFTDEIDKLVARCYIDAYQIARFNFVGEMLP